MPSIQVKVALDKEANPSKYCPARKCLWKTFDGSYCPRHKIRDNDYFSKIAKEANPK